MSPSDEAEAAAPWSAPLCDEERRLLEVGGERPTKRLLEVRTPDDERIDLRLFRFRGEGTPVLLIHGASAWSASFAAPSGASLVAALRAKEPGADVYLLDWRGGRNVVRDHARKTRSSAFTWDEAATVDIPAALREIERLRPGRNISVLGHCVGGGILAMAVSTMDPAADYFPARVVLSTLGLFHVQPWDGLLRASDFILERVLAEDPEVRTIHPEPEVDGTPWPAQLEQAWNAWPKSMLAGDEARQQTFRRLAFMFGRIAIWDRLHPSMKGNEAMREQFGAMHMTAYLHAGQMVRRGFAAPFNSAERRGRGRSRPLDERYLASDRGWKGLQAVTLITGDENDLWHRDAIDRMGEWLVQLRGTGRVDKHVLRGWAHQDLLWGQKDPNEAGPRPLDLYVQGLLG